MEWVTNFFAWCVHFFASSDPRIARRKVAQRIGNYKLATVGGIRMTLTCRIDPLGIELVDIQIHESPIARYLDDTWANRPEQFNFSFLDLRGNCVHTLYAKARGEKCTTQLNFDLVEEIVYVRAIPVDNPKTPTTTPTYAA